MSAVRIESSANAILIVSRTLRTLCPTSSPRSQRGYRIRSVIASTYGSTL